MADTAVETVRGIIESQGGTSTARTLVPALTDLGEIIGAGGAGTQYGTCSTAADTAAKEVTCEGFQLATGARIVVSFSNANTKNAVTMNVGGTGAKSVYVNGATQSSTGSNLRWGAGAVLTFTYDGTQWLLEDKAPCIFAISSTTASTAAKTATTSAAGYGGIPIINGTVAVIRSTTANTATAKLTLDIFGTGASDVYRHGAATSASNTLLWGANSTLAFVKNGPRWDFFAGDITS